MCTCPVHTCFPCSVHPKPSCWSDSLQVSPDHLFSAILLPLTKFNYKSNSLWLLPFGLLCPPHEHKPVGFSGFCSPLCLWPAALTCTSPFSPALSGLSLDSVAQPAVPQLQLSALSWTLKEHTHTLRGLKFYCYSLAPV